MIEDSQKRCARARLASIFLCATLTLSCGEERTGARGAAQAARPDVIVFMIDTLRADWLGAHDPARETSPHIDRLVREGILFEQASAPSPWTLPSVVSIFSSRFVPEHDVARDGRTLAPEIVTWAEHMRALGYATLSLHRNPYAGEIAGLERGFDSSRLISRELDGPRLRPWLDAAPAGPLFLYLHNTQPHDPHRAPEELVARFGTVSPEARATVAEATQAFRRHSRVDFVAGLPPGTTDNTDGLQREMERLEAVLPEVRALYSGAVLEADRCVGEVIAELERAGRYDDAIFVLISDHGEEFGDHGGWQHDQSLYQELVHVPLIVRLPGARHAGRRVAEPVTLIDLMPTVFELLGASERAADARGRSLVPLIEGTAQPSAPRVVAVRWDEKKHYRPWHAGRGNRNVASRDGRWKLIWNVEPDTVELYDLEADPGEERDLAGAEPLRAQRMRELARAALEEQLDRRASAGERALDGVAAGARRALQELGYVGEDE